MRLRIALVRRRPRIAFSGLVDNRQWRGVPRIERVAQSKRTRRMKVEFLTHTALASLSRGEILSLPADPISLKGDKFLSLRALTIEGVSD